MSNASTLARPYARAAFEIARSNQALAEWSSKLGFAAAVARDKNAAVLIGNPRVQVAQLISIFLPKGEAVDSMFGQFISALASNRRLENLAEIAQQFEQLKREQERTLQVTIKTAVAIEANAETALKMALQKRFDRQIEMRNEVLPELIGGAIIDAGDTVIDGSIRGRLQKLELSLTQ